MVPGIISRNDTFAGWMLNPSARCPFVVTAKISLLVFSCKVEGVDGVLPVKKEFPRKKGEREPSFWFGRCQLPLQS